MYPKNAASPEPIAIGAVVQISDGAVQTSGCTVRIKPIGVAEGDGAGTTAYSTDGIVLYTPTQAETNYTSFILIAKKTGCIPVSITVVTTASSVSGRTMPADGSVTAAVIADASIDAATFAAGAITAAAIATDAIDDDALAANAVTAIQSGLATSTNVVTSTSTITALLPAALVGGRIDASVGAVAAGAITAAGIATGAIDADALASDAVTEIWAGSTAPTASAISDQVWDEILSGHAGAGSTGEALSAAGGSGDPWITALPGAYGAGSAGKIIGDNINATISSRASQTSVTTIDDFLDTEIAAILADTDQLQQVLILATGAVTAENSAVSFTTNLTGITGKYQDMIITFLTGTLAGESKPISSFVQPGAVSVNDGFSSNPLVGETFAILNAHVHSVDAIQSGMATTSQVNAVPASTITLLGTGTQVYGHSYLESIKRIEVVSGAATMTGAGTGTEVMTSSDASKTVTFTVDGSGNISAAVWT